MEKALKEYLRNKNEEEFENEFERAYQKAKEYVRENINPHIDTLELSKDCDCDIYFPLTKDNLFVLGLDEEKLTMWVFFDNNLADA